MLCYRCGSHVSDGSEACSSCGQRFDTGLRGKTGQYRRRSLEFEAGGIKPGDLLAGRYEVRGVLGSGPLGVVFRALDREVDVDVAVKVIAPNLLQSSEERAEFLKQLKQAKRLSHPNLVRVYEVGLVEATGDQPARAFFTAQLLDGMTLRRLIDLRREKGQFFSALEAEPIFAQIGQALDHAHQTGPHGDLKPDNVMVLPDLLKVTDFGVAPSIPRAPFLAAQKQRKTDVYTAPEVLAGHPFDRRADVYSLGVILGEMLSAKPPTTGSQPDQEQPPSLSPPLEALYRRATHHDPHVRHGSAGDLAAELLTIAENAAPPSPPPLPSPRPLMDPQPLTAPEKISTSPAPAPAGPRFKAPPPPPPDALAAPLSSPNPSSMMPDAATPRVDLVLDPRDLALRPRPRTVTSAAGRPPPKGPAEAGEASVGSRIARPLPPVVASDGSAANEVTAVRRKPGTGARWPLLLGLGVVVIAGAAVAGLRQFVSWQQGEEERIAVRVRAEDRDRAKRDLDDQMRAEALDAGLAPTDGGAALTSAGTTGTPAMAMGIMLRDDAGPRVAPADAGDRALGTAAASSALVGKLDAGKAGAEIARADVHPDHADHRDHHPPPATLSSDAQPTPAPRGAGCPAGMQAIAGGSFRMGTPPSDDLGNFGDRPEHHQSLKTYCIDTYEYPNQAGQKPTTAVSFTGAESSCKRDGKRLCSEEEWEKACKGPANHRFPYGEAFDEGACRSKGGLGAAGAAAGCRSGYGVFDLSGNAAEWTSSRFQAGAADRAVKGGAAESPDYELRCAARSNRAPQVRLPGLGFRCCADPH